MLCWPEDVSISCQPSCPFLQDGYQGLQWDTEEVSFSSFRQQGVLLPTSSAPSRELLSHVFLRDKAKVRIMRINAPNQKDDEPLSSCAAVNFFCFLVGGPSLSSQAFFLLSISPFLIFSTPWRVSSGMTDSTPYLAAIGALTVHGEATAASRSTQSRIKRRSMDLEKDNRSRLRTTCKYSATLSTAQHVLHHFAGHLNQASNELFVVVCYFRRSLAFLVTFVTLKFCEVNPVVI